MDEMKESWILNSFIYRLAFFYAAQTKKKKNQISPFRHTFIRMMMMKKNCQRYEKKRWKFFFCSKLIGYTTVLCSKRKITVCMCVCQSGMIIQIELDTFFSLSLSHHCQIKNFFLYQTENPFQIWQRFSFFFRLLSL